MKRIIVSVLLVSAAIAGTYLSFRQSRPAPIPVRHSAIGAKVGSILLARQQLTAPLTLYVSPSGNDANNGLTTSTPLLTINAAINLLANGYDLNGFQPTIQLTPGTYAPFQLLEYMSAGVLAQQTNPVIQGDPVNPSSYQIVNSSGGAAALGVGVSTTWILRGLTFSSPQPNGYGIEMDYHSRLYVQACEFGPCGLAHAVALFGGSIEFLYYAGSPIFTVAGSAPICLWAYEQGQIIVQAAPISFTGNPAISSIFAASQNNSLIFSAATGVSGGVGINMSAFASYGSGVQGASTFPPSTTNTGNVATAGGWIQ